MLGANGAQIFIHVILPGIKAKLVYGSVSTFARSLGEFGVTVMILGNLALQIDTVPLLILAEFDKGNVGAANSIAVLLVIISFVLFGGFKLANRIMERKESSNANRPITQES